MTAAVDLKCARDYPTPCLEPIAFVTEFTCRHDHVVQSGLCQAHGEGTTVEDPEEWTPIGCDRCQGGRNGHQCQTRVRIISASEASRPGH